MDEDKISALGKLVENTPLALIAIGAVGFVIAAAGSWPTPELRVNEFGWRIALAMFGIIVAGVGGFLFWSEKTHRENKDLRRDYGIEISSPVPSTPGAIPEVPARFSISGRYKIKPPDNIIVKVLEFIPDSRAYWPKNNVIFHDREKMWESSVSIGGTPGQRRIIQVVKMGKDGKALCDYFDKVGSYLDKLDRQLQIPRRIGIDALTSDIVESQRITVIYKPAPPSNPHP